MRTNLPGWSIALLVHDRRLAHHTGLPLDERLAFENGGLPVGACSSAGRRRRSRERPGATVPTDEARSSSQSSRWCGARTCIPTGRPATVPIGIEMRGCRRCWPGWSARRCCPSPASTPSTWSGTGPRRPNATSGLVARSRGRPGRRWRPSARCSPSAAPRSATPSRGRTRWSASSRPNRICGVRSSAHVGEQVTELVADRRHAGHRPLVGALGQRRLGVDPPSPASATSSAACSATAASPRRARPPTRGSGSPPPAGRGARRGASRAVPPSRRRAAG